MSPLMNKHEVEAFFDKLAPSYDQWKAKNDYYYNMMKSFLARMIPPGSRVLDIGCATGQILAAAQPNRGVGVDISGEMVKIASKKYPHYTFIHSSIEELQLDEKFDYIIMVDFIDQVYDVQRIFESLWRFCLPHTRIILTTVNPYWEPFLYLWERLGWKTPEVPHNFLDKGIITRLADMLDFTVSYSGFMLLMPVRIPLISYLANSVGVRIGGLNRLSFVQYMIIQPTVKNTTSLGLGCSVIIPCYNEQDNIEEAIKRIPLMGKKTEIVVVNDGSQDQTADKVRALQKDYPDLRLIDYKPNHGKGYAVRKGFEEATQEILMILDADFSTPPEELPRFFEPLNKGLCQFVNGTRMVYPMEKQAMRFFNLLGNKLFGYIMSFITQQKLTDTLCGTKAFYKFDLKRIKWALDKWGDFDILFGCAKAGCKFMEVPVHYKTRISGESKMKAFRHGFHLLRACFLGFRELILIPRREFYSQNDH